MSFNSIILLIILHYNLTLSLDVREESSDHFPPISID